MNEKDTDTRLRVRIFFSPPYLFPRMFFVVQRVISASSVAAHVTPFGQVHPTRKAN